MTTKEKAKRYAEIKYKEASNADDKVSAYVSGYMDAADGFMYEIKFLRSEMQCAIQMLQNGDAQILAENMILKAEIKQLKSDPKRLKLLIQYEKIARGKL